MARPRTFDYDDVVRRSAAVFRAFGYNGASVDDLVAATKLQRGSLYKAFGSKLGIFVAALTSALATHPPTDPDLVDLITVALREVVARDSTSAALCEEWLTRLEGNATRVLGERLLTNLPKGNHRA